MPPFTETRPWSSSALVRSMPTDLPVLRPTNAAWSSSTVKAVA